MELLVALVGDSTFDTLLTACALNSVGFLVAYSGTDLSVIDVAIKKSQPDVLILSTDSNMKLAVASAHKARKINPSLGLVFLTNVPDFRLTGIAEKELPYGTQVIFKNSVTQIDILTKNIEQSLQVLEDKAAGRKVDSISILTQSEFTSTLQSLTQVQIQTLRLVALGNSNAEIARIRLVTEKAVEHTITRMLQALKIATNPHHNARVLLAREYYRWVAVEPAEAHLIS